MSATLHDILSAFPELPRHAELDLDYEMRQQAGVSMILREGDPVDVLFQMAEQHGRVGFQAIVMDLFCHLQPARS